VYRTFSLTTSQTDLSPGGSNCAGKRLCASAFSFAVMKVISFYFLAFTGFSAGAFLEDFKFTDVRDLVGQMREARSNNRVWMSVHEQHLIESFLDENTTMLEYGSGFSTLWFSQFVKSYYSIEHSREWYDLVSPQISVLANVQYKLAAVDPGYKGWAGGFSEGTYEQFEDYIKTADKFKIPGNRIDRVLIDGRARASCAKHVLKYLHDNSYIFIHDFVGRTRYHETLDTYYIREAIVFNGQSVVIARPKPDVLRAIQEGNIQL
jgi:hypothetical protein